MGDQVAQAYSRIQSDHATFNDAKAVKEVADSLKPFRPPTAPESDLEVERQKIIDIQANNILFLQIALALVVIALISYMVFPIDVAHGISFLLLSMGISFGFFLRK